MRTGKFETRNILPVFRHDCKNSGPSEKFPALIQREIPMHTYFPKKSIETVVQVFLQKSDHRDTSPVRMAYGK